LANIKTLAVNLIARTGIFERKMNKSRKTLYDFQKSAHRTRQRLQSMFVGVVSGYGISRFVQSLIKAASAAEETQNKFEVVFGKQTKAAERWADELGEAVGRSTTTLKKYMAGLQDIFVPIGYGREQAFEMSKAITKLGLDIASFNDKADADVLNNLSSALTGMHRTVRRYGIIILNTTLNQELMNMGIERGITDATEMEKVQARLNLIFKMSVDAQGDLIRTGDSYANQLKRLTENVLSLKVALGEKLLPAATEVVKILNNYVDIIDSDDKTAETMLKRLGHKQAFFETLSQLQFTFGFERILLGNYFGKQEKDFQRAFDWVESVKAAKAELQDKSAGAGEEAPGSLKTMSLATQSLIEDMEKLAQQTEKTIRYWGETPLMVKYLDFVRQGKNLVGEQAVLYDQIVQRLGDAVVKHEELTKAAEAQAEAEKEAAKRQREIEQAAELKQRQLESYAKGVVTATRTPLETYENKIGKLSEILNKGLINWETYGRAVRMAREELERTAGLKIKPLEAPTFGEAKQIESPSLVDIRAMTLGAPDSQVSELRRANELNQQQINVLERIESGGLH
jgi:hypothetical protein